MKRHDLDFTVKGSTAEEVEEKAHKVLAEYFGEGNYAIEKIDTERMDTVVNFAGGATGQFSSSVTGRKQSPDD